VREAEHGQLGLDIMMRSSFDLVLSDIEMPVMNGLKCVQCLRAWEKEHRPERRQLVCCVTGAGISDISDEEIISAGMDEVWRKPYNKDMMTRFRSMLP
jgi:CheY-like chemotaxis protein